MRGQLGDLAHQALLLLAEAADLQLGLGSLFPGRAGVISRAHEVEAVRPERLLRRLVLVRIADERHIIEALVAGNAEELRLRRRGAQRRVNIRHVCRRGQAGRGKNGLLRALAAQRDIQVQPGRERGHGGLQPCRLACAAADLLLLARYLLSHGQVCGELPLVQHRVNLRLGQGFEEAALGRGIPVHELYGVRQQGVIGPLNGKVAAGTAPEPVEPGALELARFAELHAAQQQQIFQQGFALSGHDGQTELFHLYDCHISRSLPFQQ